MSPLRPMGPSVMMEKLQEMRAQFDPPQPAVKFELPSQETPSPLSGAITPEGSFAPLDPFGGSIKVQSTMSWISPERLRSLIQRAANENGVDENLLDALVQAESNYNPNAISRARAMGLTQLMPKTAEHLGVDNPFDPVQNLQGGAKYLSQMITEFKGDLPKALAAYNAGPGAVTKHGGIPPYEETRNYVSKVMKLYEAKAAAK